MRFAVALILFAACGSKSATDGLPPATDWNTGDPPVVPGQGPRGVPNADPHGGSTNPHEGVVAPPLGDGDQQMPNDSTHAFAQQGDDTHAQAPDDPTHAPAKDPAAPLDPNKRIKGTFTLDPKVAGKLKPDGAVFLIVKKADAAGQPTGNALAVGRESWKGPGQGFELGFENVTGEVLVIARYDQDLDASTTQPGDVIGMTRAKIPADNVVLELDTLLP